MSPIKRNWFDTLKADDAAAELRRLHAQNKALLETLKRIEMATGATVCNTEWVNSAARRAIEAAVEENK